MTLTISRACRVKRVDPEQGPRCQGPASTLHRPQSGLPQDISSFVGGGDQTAAVVARLGSARLVTLTGSGGVGKTRLALQAARAVQDDYDYCSWNALSSVVDGADIGTRIGATMGGGSSASGWMTVETLAVGIRNHQVLLVLDNCEHLISACADAVL